MRNFGLKSLALGAAFVCSLALSDSFAADFKQLPASRVPELRKANREKSMILEGRRRMAVKEPETQLDNRDNFDLLEGPDGTTWFYISEYDMEEEVISEYYTETYIVGYTFHIYDSAFREVGTVKDKISLAEGETKVAHAVLDPTVTRTFFNEDSKPEVIVYLAMNTSAQLDYEVNYYNKVYTIGGEKDEDGNDVSLLTIGGRCVDALNAAAPGEPEDFYLTFVDDWYPDFAGDDISYEEFIDLLNQAKTTVQVYAKPTSDGAPAVILEKDVFLTRYPGDTTDGIYFISKSVDGVPYFIFSQYEKPYFIDPTGFAADESATPGNSLVIENYKYEKGKADLLSTTKVPVVLKNESGKVNYTFYSIGAVAWKDDIDMDVNGTPANPAYLVARDYTTAAMLEDVESYYDLYSNEGKLIKTIASKVEGLNVLAPIAGIEPQALFWSLNDDEEYVFSFVNLHSGDNVLTVPQVFNGEELTASCQRVSAGGGDYEYVFELQKDGVDEDGNDLKRMLWLKRDGSLDRIDLLNMGKGVQYASVNLFQGCVSAYLFDTDDAVEYAILVKRTSDDGITTRNEFLIADDGGEWLARFSEDDGRGAPYTFTVVPGSPNRLLMGYLDGEEYNIDMYDLPLLANGNGPTDNETGSGIEDIESAGDSAAVRYYNLYGIEVANPQPGQLLIRRSGSTSTKIIY